MASMTSAKRAGTVVALALSAVGITGQGPTLQERLGHPADARLLVIHADDLGMSHSVNRATFEAFENGWITSASILVPCPWFPEVARWARAHPDADLGIHLAVNSEWTGFRWGPLSPRDAVASLLDKDGYFPLLETDVVDHAKPADIDRELRAQIDRARDAGVKLTHLDSHMATMFRTPEFFDVYRKLGAAYDLPVLMERLGDRGGEQSRVGDGGARGRADRSGCLDSTGSRESGLAAGVRKDARAAAPRRVPADRAPGIRRRGDAWRHIRSP